MSSRYVVLDLRSNSEANNSVLLTGIKNLQQFFENIASVSLNV